LFEGLGVERICVFESRTRRVEEIGRTGVDPADLEDRDGAEA
jgi:hypothetical protein